MPQSEATLLPSFICTMKCRKASNLTLGKSIENVIAIFMVGFTEEIIIQIRDVLSKNVLRHPG